MLTKHSSTISQTSPGFCVFHTILLKTLLEKRARNEQFLLFPVFSTLLENFPAFHQTYNCRLQILLI